MVKIFWSVTVFPAKKSPKNEKQNSLRHKKYRVLWRRLFGIANRIGSDGEISVTKLEKCLLLGDYLVKKNCKNWDEFIEPLNFNLIEPDQFHGLRTVKN